MAHNALALFVRAATSGEPGQVDDDGVRSTQDSRNGTAGSGADSAARHPTVETSAR